MSGGILFHSCHQTANCLLEEGTVASYLQTSTSVCHVHWNQSPTVCKLIHTFYTIYSGVDKSLAHGYLTGQKNPRVLRNPKFHHRVHNILQPELILSQMHPFYTIPPFFSKIAFYIVFLSITLPFSSGLFF